MPISRNKALEIARRRHQVSQLYLKGYMQMAIAHDLGVSQGTVSNDLKAIESEWRASTIRDFNLARQKEVLRLEGLIQSASESFEQSKQPMHTARVRGAGAGENTEKTVRNQNGDPRYLEIIRKCSADLRALLLLDRTADAKSSTADETGSNQSNLSAIADGLSNDELRILKKVRDRLAVVETGRPGSTDR